MANGLTIICSATLSEICPHPALHAALLRPPIAMRSIRVSAAGRTNNLIHVARPVTRVRPWDGACKRQVHIPQVIAPPLILTGLFVTLWTWKCAMLVLFQNTIIYNPFMPPNARSLRIEDFARQCRGIQWREERIRSLDGTEIALCVTEEETEGVTKRGSAPETPVYILYFQGKLSRFQELLPSRPLN